MTDYIKSDTIPQHIIDLINKKLEEKPRTAIGIILYVPGDQETYTLTNFANDPNEDEILQLMCLNVINSRSKEPPEGSEQ